MTDSWEVVKWFSNPVPGGTLGFLKLVGRHFKAKKKKIKSNQSGLEFKGLEFSQFLSFIPQTSLRSLAFVITYLLMITCS